MKQAILKANKKESRVKSAMPATEADMYNFEIFAQFLCQLLLDQNFFNQNELAVAFHC